HAALLAVIATSITAAGFVARPDTVVPLDTLDLSSISQDWGKPHSSRSVDDHPLEIGGRSFARGVGTHANSEWVVDLKGSATKFTANVGVDQEVGQRGSIVFVVLVDGREAVRTGTLRGGEPAQQVAVDLTG